MDRLEANALHVPGQRHHRLCEGTAEREPELSLVLLPSVCRGTGSQKRLQGQERFARVSEMLRRRVAHSCCAPKYKPS